MRRKPMRVIILQEELYSYLCYVVEQYARGGIDPREGLSLYHLHKAVKSTPEVDESQVARLAIGGDGNASLSVEDGKPPGEKQDELPQEPPAQP
jgi:hypothetical protein